MTIREAFLQIYPDGDNRPDHYFAFFQSGYQAAIEQIKKDYTLCEKEPMLWNGPYPLYREAKS
jgi:hypothetical protein